MDRNHTLRCTLSVLAFSALVACGGGGGSGDGQGPRVERSPAEGIYVGTTSDGRNLSGVVLENGDYWMLYTSSTNETGIGGVVPGSSSATAGAFASTDARDFNFERGAVTSGTVTGNYVTKRSFSGELRRSGSQTTGFTTTYDDTYEKPATLANLAGSYSGAVITFKGAEGANFTVSTSGSISGSTSGGCSFTGTASPRGATVVYDVRLSFLGGSCRQGTSTTSGVDLLDLEDSILTGAAMDAARSDVVFFAAQKAGQTGAATGG